MERAKDSRGSQRNRVTKALSHKTSGTDENKKCAGRQARQAGSSAKRQKREGISDGIYLLGVEFGGGFGSGFGAGFGGGGGVWSLWEF